MRIEPASLISIRELAGHTQSELARLAGISQGHISDLERGDKQPRPATVDKLAAALTVPPGALLRACTHGADRDDLALVGHLDDEMDLRPGGEIDACKMREMVA